MNKRSDEKSKSKITAAFLAMTPEKQQETLTLISKGIEETGDAELRAAYTELRKYLSGLIDKGH